MKYNIIMNNKSSSIHKKKNSSWILLYEQCNKMLKKKLKNDTYSCLCKHYTSQTMTTQNLKIKKNPKCLHYILLETVVELSDYRPILNILIGFFTNNVCYWYKIIIEKKKKKTFQPIPRNTNSMQNNII